MTIVDMERAKEGKDEAVWRERDGVTYLISWACCSRFWWMASSLAAGSDGSDGKEGLLIK